VEVAGKINRVLEKLMPLITPMGVISGVVFPGFFVILRPYIIFIFAVMTFSGALNLRPRDLGKAASSPAPLLIFFFSAHVFMPVVVLFLSRLFFRDDSNTISGYVMVYSAPTAVTGFIWATIFRGNLALSLALIMLDTILAPIVMPGTVRLLVGTSVSIDMTGMAVSLLFMVVVPTIIGVFTNELSRGRIPALACPYLTPFSKICMLLVIAANSAAIAHQIRLDNPRLPIIVAACLCFSVLSFSTAKLASVAGRVGKDKQISLFFASGLRNTSVAMTLAINFFPPAAALPAILNILFQQIMAAFSSRLLIGKNKEAAPLPPK